MAVVSALYVYPIKSCAGIRVSEWPVVERGFYADRRWMIVDPKGKFVTQRELAELSQVRTAIDGHTLHLTAPGRAPLTLPLAFDAGLSRSVTVWRDTTLGVVHPEGSEWISKYLSAPYELVYMPDNQQRQVNPDRARPGDIVSFADGYPFLTISEASLADLNARLEKPLEMPRFRPNIVIGESEPYAEDGYTRVRIGELSFRGVKRCERCVITTIDPETGERGREPLRTLAKYRLEDQKVWFGMNMIHDGHGVLRIGDRVEMAT